MSMPRRFRIALSLLTAALVATALRPLSAQSDTGRVESLRLIGVLDAKTGDWINRAVVHDTLGNETFTTRNGVAALNVLTPIAGFYLLEIRKEGYAPRRLRLRADTTVELMIALAPAPLGDVTKLPAVVTTERRRIAEDAGEKRGFFERCQYRTVTCVGRAELDRSPSAVLATLLGYKPGLHRQCTMTGRGPVPTSASTSPDPYVPGNVMGCLLTMRSTAGRYCQPTYFIDGFEWSPLGGISQAQIDAFLPPSKIEGIEVYQSLDARPIKYEIPFSVCGTILIWTR